MFTNRDFASAKNLDYSSTYFYAINTFVVFQIIFVSFTQIVCVIQTNLINESSLHIKRGNAIRQDTPGRKRELLLSRLGLDTRSPP